MYKRFRVLATICLTALRLGASLQEKLRLCFFLCSRLWGARMRSQLFRIRVLGTTVAVELRNNFADAFVLNEAFIGHEYDTGLLASEPSVIFDIGANVGFLTVYLKMRYPQARVFCFEPDPDNFKQLVATTRQFPDVTCFQTAVGAKNEQRAFYRSPVFHMRNSLIKVEGSESFEVEVISLDEAMHRAGVASIDLLKFDVEGAEVEIFPPFTHFEAVRAIVGEIHPYLWKRDEEKRLIELLERHYVLTVSREGNKTFVSGTAL